MSELSGLAGVSSFVNLAGQSMLQEDAQAENRKNMAMSNRMGIANQINSARNVVEGYKKAGLSPALAANGNFSPVANPSVPSSPMGTFNSQNFSEGAMQMAQADLLSAEARKANAEANRMEHEDEGSNQVIKQFAERVLNDSAHPLNDDDRRYWESVQRDANNGMYNLGDVNSQHQLENLVQNHAKTFDEVYSKLYQEQLMKAYLAHEVPEDMAKMPRAKVAEIGLVLGKLAAETYKINSETALNVGRAEEIQANIKKLLAEAKSLYHGDLWQMWDAGDYGKVFATIAGAAAKEVIGWAAFGKVAKVAQGARIAGSKTFGGSVLSNVDRQVELSRKQYNARSWAETMHKRNKHLGELEKSKKNAWQRSNALEGELQGYRSKKRSRAFPNPSQEELPF